MSLPTVGTKEVPNIKNYFNIDLTDNVPPPKFICLNTDQVSAAIGELKEKTGNWANPHLDSNQPRINSHLVTPYVPDRAFTVGKEFRIMHLSAGEIELVTDVTGNILGFLDVNTLIKFSEVSKSCYLAVHHLTEAVWVEDLKRRGYNNVKVVEGNHFSSREQVLIFYHSVHEAKKPYRAKKEWNRITCTQLKEMIDATNAEFKKADGDVKVAHARQQTQRATMQEHWKLDEFLANGENAVKGDGSPQNRKNNGDLRKAVLRQPVEFEKMAANDIENNGKLSVHYLKNKFIICDALLHEQWGRTYDRTDETIRSYSHQWKLNEATQLLLPMAFNNQQMFDASIHAAEEALKSAAQQSTPVVEDVANGNSSDKAHV